MILFFGAEFTAPKFYNGVIPPPIAKGIIQQEKRYIIAFFHAIQISFNNELQPITIN
jgi:hypothetical protein